MDTQTLFDRYAAGARDFSKIDLNRGLHLEDADLSGINLSGAMLYRATYDKEQWKNDPHF